MLTLNQNLPEGFRPVLFELYFSTGFLERLLEVLGVGLSKTFFDYAGSAVNEFLSLLEAKTGEFLNELDNCELLSAGSLEDNVERRFLLGSGSAGCGTCCYSNCGCSGFDAVLVLEDGCEFVYFLNGKVY